MAAANYKSTNSTGKDTNVFATQVSAGVSSAGQIPALNASGVLDPTLMPPGVEVQVRALPASEALAAGAIMNIWSNAGVVSVRNADNSAPGKEANGYVLAAVASAATAMVYLQGPISGLTGLTVNTAYYLGTGGAITTTPPDPTNSANAGKLVQYLGRTDATTELNFVPANPTYL
jgi:hypothetical protein